MSANVQLITVMSLYLGLLIIWGIYQGLKVKNSSDYSIGGRQIKGWVAALSERATGESSWALLGLPGAAYASGITEIWTAVGCVVGIITAWALLSWRLQQEGAKYKVDTFSDYIAKKHSDFEKPLRILSSLTITFFFFFYIGAQLLGGGKVLNSMFGLSASAGMLLTLAIIIPYTIIGGLRSVMYTDVVQALVMITTLIITPIVGLIFIANNPDVVANSIGEALQSAGSEYTSATGGLKGFAAGIAIFSGFSWFFGYLGGQPQITTRFMAIKNQKQAKQARNIGILWTLIAYVGALSIGWLGLAIFGAGYFSDREQVMPAVILKLFPPAIAGILITGAVAAMISTADSLLVLSSTELSENILGRNIISTKRKLLISRITTTLIAFLALGTVYIVPSDLIYTIVSYVWSGIGGTFSIVILFSLFSKKFNGKAAFVTILAGVVFTIIWISTGMEEKITSRFLTFAVAGFTAIFSTLFFQTPKNKSHYKK